MDGYPGTYVSHNLPLIILSGLGSGSGHASGTGSYPLLHENGFRITSDIPPVTGSNAEQLLRIFLDADASKGRWNRRHENEPVSNIGFQVKEVGREYTLPPRKANPPPNSPAQSPSSPTPPTSSYPAPILHSPLSPLTPSSSTYPDGLMTSHWLVKHQELLPSAFISFFTFTSNPNLSSVQDNHLKAAVNQIRGNLASSFYRTRFVAVLCSENSILEADVEGRLANIRRATGLDSKSSLFFFPPNLSVVETRAFVDTVLAALQPACVEYYRELSKHARRKRNRGSVPPPTAPPTFGTSQTLRSQGWNVRYEFKLAVFAEFRQEMDAAGRSYEAAYESLVSQDVFETIASWSPRFNEARLLADVIAIRILRCLLWNGQTTAAVQSWENHRARTQDLIDRRGKGSGNYGWKAWEARWCQVMAEVIEMADLPVFAVPEAARKVANEANRVVEIYAAPEKSIPIGERTHPWHLLHHGGYWSNQSLKRTIERRTLAEEIPEEDRTSPAQSPASHIASKFDMYDTYLCPEPYVESPLPGHEGFDHSATIIKTCMLSQDQFDKRGQRRAVEQLRLQLVREYMKRATWHDALKEARSLWLDVSWRRSGWWHLVEELGWAVRECAFHVGDGSSVLSTDFELLSNQFTPRSEWQYNLSKSLDGLVSSTGKPAVVLRAGDVVSFVSVQFAFSKVEGNVSEPLQYQVVVTSQAQEGSAPVKLSRLSLGFDDILKAVVIDHHLDSVAGSAMEVENTQIQEIALHESASSDGHPSDSSPLVDRSSDPLVGSANLTFYPGQVKVFTFTTIPRDSGIARAVSCTLSMEESSFSLDYVVSFQHDHVSASWWTQGRTGASGKPLGHDQVESIKILPRPPKISIYLPNLRREYYTDELVSVDVDISNGEEEAAQAAIEVRLLGPSEGTPKISWGTSPGQSHDDNAPTSPSEVDSQTTHLPRRPVGKLAPAAKTTQTVSFRGKSNPSEFVLEIKILYHLMSSPDTPLSKILASDIVLVPPFDIKYEFSPRLHLDPWPSFFFDGNYTSTAGHDNGLATNAGGITQKWCLTASVVSFATEVLTLESMDISVLGINDEIITTVTREEHRAAPTTIAPRELREMQFIVDIQRLILEDRRSASLDLAFEVRWRRSPSGSESNITVLSVPRLLIPGGEPRVLACVGQPSLGSPGLLQLDYVFENPSMHYLTLNLIMEASEDFAFSGVKTKSLDLVPLSRHTVRYTLLPYAQGTWIQPQLKVIDMYFNKLLRISATEGVKSEKKGILIWVKADT